MTTSLEAEDVGDPPEVVDYDDSSSDFIVLDRGIVLDHLPGGRVPSPRLLLI